MKFRSKIGIWFHLIMFFLVAGVCGAEITLSVVLDDVIYLIVGIFVFIIVGVVALPIYFNTNYTFEEDALHIRSGWMINTRILYKDIISTEETTDPASSAALSFDRISIKHSRGEELVSPRNKQEFIRQLHQRIA